MMTVAFVLFAVAALLIYKGKSGREGMLRFAGVVLAGVALFIFIWAISWMVIRWLAALALIALVAGWLFRRGGAGPVIGVMPRRLIAALRRRR